MCSSDLVLVHRRVHDAMMHELVPLVKALVVGDPLDEATDVGPVIDSGSADRIMEWIGALSVAMLISGLTLVMADRIRKLLGDSVVSAIEKLMGLVLTAIATEMVLAGLKRYFFESP